MRILIIQTAFIGDVVLATPLIEKLKANYPNTTIDFLLRKGNELLLKHNPHISTVLVFDKKHNKYQNLFKLIKQIRNNKYDYVINAQRYFTTGLITSLSEAKTTIGFNKNPLSFTFTHCIKHVVFDSETIHEVDRNLQLIESLVDKGSQKPKLYVSEEDEKVIPTDYSYVCVAPASVWFTKQFPYKKWCALINKIPEQYKVHLIGGPEDVVLCEKIKEATDTNRVVVSAGQLSLLQSIALIKGAKITFSNDSAPMHFASAVNAPVIAIFCSTIPQFGFGPLSDNSHVVETDENLTCRPCGLHGKKACPKQHFKCSDIDINKILEKANL